MKITKELLESHGACKEQIEIFAREWPEGVEVTEEACLRAAELGLHLEWAASELLTPKLYAEYERRRDLLYDEYERQYKPLRANYCRQCAVIFAKVAS